VTRATGAEDLSQKLAAPSLLDGGLLDGPSAPLLLVNGLFDKTCNPADMELLLQVGAPKTARFFATGHMGFTPTTTPTIVE
jgi:esterase FrsA